ncbi:MAG: RloB family protein [Anaerolineales bacterium]
MPKKREFLPRKRKSRIRDPKLIIIATEGSDTEPAYFKDMASPKYFYNPRIHVEVLEREGTKSAPEYVIAALNQFSDEYNYEEGLDELWLVVDTDDWGDKKLADIATKCQQKGYEMAVSNPCFELWLLLHVTSLSEYSAETLDEFRENRRQGDRTRLERELVILLGEFSKSSLKTEHFLPHVEEAISQARELDEHPEHRWPNDLGSRVYLLAKKIMDRDPR